ncbi:hypothetical protein [Streptomyces sp. LUP47B]|uniref:hypothetical protein n=1 Tax=Streptomyces sp. LUP47B TaxID=1890286 RepID=UPI002109BC35|nr:hypothetical protein [Streptomyces sp. LUP47B]
MACQSERCRTATRAQTLDALRQQVKARPCCRPESALGFLEPVAPVSVSVSFIPVRGCPESFTVSR